MKKKGDIHSREVMKSKGTLLVVTVEDVTLCTQLFRERLEEKVHASISKGIVGGFEYTVFQFKEK